MIAAKHHNSKMPNAFNICPTPGGANEVCGNGVCSNSTWKCECDPGYRYDSVHTIYFNCFLSDAVWLAFILSNCLFTAFTIAVGCFVLSKTRKRVNQIVKVLVLGLIFYFGYFVSLAVTGYIGVATAVCTIGWVNISLFAQSTLLVRLIIEPIYSMVGRQYLPWFTTFFKSWFAFCASALTTCVIVGQVFLGQEDYIRYNNANNIVFLVMAMFEFVLQIFLTTQLRKLALMVNELSKPNPDLIHRIHVLRNASLLVTISTGAIFIAVPITHFVIQTHPYRFVPIWMLTMSIPVWDLIVLYFLYAKPPESSSSVPSSVTVKN